MYHCITVLTFVPVTSVHQIFLLAYRPAESPGVPEYEPVPVSVSEDRPLRGPAHPDCALLVVPVTVGVLCLLDSQAGAEETPHQAWCSQVISNHFIFHHLIIIIIISTNHFSLGWLGGRDSFEGNIKENYIQP